MDIEIDFEDNSWTQNMSVYVPYEEFLNTMGLVLTDRTQRYLIYPHIFWGLKRFELISRFSFTNMNVICAHYPEAKGPGFVISPSLFGIDLYMWANGYSDIPAFSYLNKNIEFVNSDLLDMPEGAEIFSYM